jgi:hypothetical protein
MGLINLTTDLKSLRYGKDRIGGGDSGQPYIKSNIPDDLSPYIGTQDYINRGGIRVVRDSATDVLRLGRMFVDTKSPNGIFFASKQNLLSRTAVRTQTSGILNEGSYSPLNTLAQAGVVAFGSHLNKQGDPFADSGAYSTNENLYDVKVILDEFFGKNRLINLLVANQQQISKKVNGITLNNPGINVMTYPGGPGSDLGIGNTTIKYSATSKTFLSNPSKNNNFSNNTWVYNADVLSNPYESSRAFTIISPDTPTTSDVREGSIASPKVQDFRKILREKLGPNTQDGKIATESGATPFSLDYNTQNYDLRTNLGQPGQRANKNYASYDLGVDYSPISTNQGGYNPGLDKITSLPIYRSEAVIQESVKNDLCKFRIAVIDNNSPNFKTFMHFRAFLGPMSDSYTAKWNPVNYLGRGEDFYTYNGFTRTISLSWTVAAQSKEELIPMYKKLNYLASSLTPDYGPSANGSGYMRGNLVQLTVGGYLYEQPGIITSLTYDIQEDTPWEIGISSNELGGDDASVKELPHIIRVTGFSFIPIQTFLPRLQINGFGSNQTTSGSGFANSYGDQRYIALSNGATENYNDTDLIRRRARVEVGPLTIPFGDT